MPLPASSVVFTSGRGNFPMLRIVTPRSTAEIYLHGAHLTHYQRTGEPPLLFLSASSRFQHDAAIRGGIPIIFPWFGKPAGRSVQHGFARLREWTVSSIEMSTDGSVSARLTLPAALAPIAGSSGESVPDTSGVLVEYRVTVGDWLGAELTVTNGSAHPFAFENCLHTYFAVGDVSRVTVTGLTGTTYLDQQAGYARRMDDADAIRVAGEVDRAYVKTTATVDIHDPVWNRTIRVEKSGSHSTVVWNPWVAKAKAMADFGDDEYPKMVCVESGNIGEDRVDLAPGDRSVLAVRLVTLPA